MNDTVSSVLEEQEDGILEERPPLREVLHPGQYKRVAIVTGSEGGFSVEEAEAAKAAGAVTVGLGPRILRCETAPLAALTSVMLLTGNLE